MKRRETKIRVVLFDVGGVLVELSGITPMLELMGNRVSAQELWKIWLTSPAVRAFETGRRAPEIFARELIAELSLPVTCEELLREFGTWARGELPGALDLVRRIPPGFTRATLSNSNSLHWPRVLDEMRFRDAFDHHFASHLTGKIKPDRAAFQHVTAALRCDAGEVLFLDDNEINVAAARAIGMKAIRVVGVAAAERALVEAGVLAN